MSEKSPFMSCSTLSKEQICLNQSKTQELLHASFMHGQHDALKKHMEKNPDHQHFDGCLAEGLELVINRKRTMSDVAPTLVILLQNGAKWNGDDLIMPGRMTPYHVICRTAGDHEELLELMIKELGLTTVDAKDDVGCTAMMYAVSNANIECVKCLIANGADVNLINDNPNVTNIMLGPLIDSIQLLRPNSPHSYNTMMSIFDALLDSGADVNKPCHRHIRTPIMYAAAAGNVNCVEKLFEKEVEVNHRGRAGHTLWKAAADAGCEDVLKCLAEHNGIDKSSIDKNGVELLYDAVCSDNIEVVRYLLKQGVTMTTFVPQTYVEACTDCGTNILYHYVNAEQLYTDPYIKAITLEMLDVLKLMDEYGCELYKSAHILRHAICVNSLHVVEYLLCNYKYPLNYEYAVRSDYSTLDFGHQTFLINACERPSVKVVKLFLERGADPNKKFCSEKCRSVINVAIQTGHVEIIAQFLREGVNVNSRSYYPCMDMVLPFEVALYKDSIYVAEMLLVSGSARGVHILDNTHELNTDLEPEMQELMMEWNVYKNNVVPLKQRCRMVILNHLSPQADKKITELSLPTQLVKYLSIPELDDIVETYKGKPPSYFYAR